MIYDLEQKSDLQVIGLHNLSNGAFHLCEVLNRRFLISSKITTNIRVLPKSAENEYTILHD